MNIIPALAWANFIELKECIDFADDQYHRLHLTISDGSYDQNITFGLDIARQVIDYSKSLVSFHLMMTDPLPYLDQIEGCYPDIVFLHLNHVKNPLYVIRRFREKGIQVGLALAPQEQYEPFAYLQHEFEGVLKLLAQPDTRGQELLPSLFPEVKKLAQLPCPLWVEGGITQAYGIQLEDLGAENIIMGQNIFRRKSSDFAW